MNRLQTWYQKKTSTPKGKRRLRRWMIVLGALIAIRVCLPYIILHFANKKLAALDGYYGHVDDIDLAIIRGAYTINDIYIHKVDSISQEQTEFFKCPEIDLSVEWRALFQGKIVGEVEFDTPVVNYEKAATVGKEAEKDSTSFIELIQDFMPIDINHFAVNNGQVHYKDNTTSPAVDVPLTEISIEGKGLTNQPEEGVVLPASIDFSGRLYDGTMSIGVKLDPLNEAPTFDLNAQLTQLQLNHLNPFFKAYGNFDLKAGTLEISTEVAAKNGEFTGYVKPVIKDLDVVQFNKEEGRPFQIAWEALLAGVAEIFQNQRKEQLAAKADFNGRFKDPNVQTLDAIISLLRNAFIQALQPSIEDSISLQQVSQNNDDDRGLLEKMFGKDKNAEVKKDDKEKTRKEKREERKKK